MRGRVVPLSRQRRLICDLMHFSAGVPTVPVQRTMNLAGLIEARRRCQERPPWTAIFAKAFALAAIDFPPLRRAYCKLPWPHLYEYPGSVASIMVEREVDGEPAVLGLRVKEPESRSITEIGSLVREASTVPVDSVSSFRQALRLAAWPRPIRRLLWWLGLNIGRQRANYFGTFGVTVYSSLGAESLHPLSPLTATLNYGVIGPDGQVAVRMIYDHRVMAGATVARALARVEHILNTSLCTELLALAPETRASGRFHPTVVVASPGAASPLKVL